MQECECGGEARARRGERGGAHLQRRRMRPTCSDCVALLLVVETPAHRLKQLPGQHCWCQPGSIPGKSGLQPVTSFWSAALFASRLLVQCIKAVHFGHVSPPPRAHILCTGVRVSSENREPHALHVNTGGAAGPFSCWFETIGCGGLGGTFKIPTRSVSRLLVLGAFLHVLLRSVLTTLLELGRLRGTTRSGHTHTHTHTHTRTHERSEGSGV